MTTTLSEITTDTQATPALVDFWEVEAIDRIDAVQTPEDAERLLADIKIADDAVRIYRLGAEREQRWACVRLSAEHRWGELLPRKQPGRPQKNSLHAVTNTQERVAQARARKVAEVPKEVFLEYIQNPKPTRGGLFRFAKAKMPKSSAQKASRRTIPPLWEDSDVLAWVAKRDRAGRTRDQMVVESEAGEHYWPRPGEKLGQNGVDICRAILRDREVRGDEMPRRRRSGQRLREIREKRKIGSHSDLVDIQWRIVQMTRELETTNVESYVLDAEGDTAETLKLLADDLIELQTWMNRTTSSVWARLKHADKIEKIRKLRDTKGRTPAEAATANALADELQRKLDQEMLISR